MRVSVVIPNWNGRRFLEPLLQDLRAQTLPVGEVIIVDNGSVDGSAALAEAAGARVIGFERNRGFAPAVNAGVAAAAEDAVAVLNNDLRLSADWLERLTAAFTTTDSFAAGKVLSAAQPDRLDATFDTLCRGGTAWRCGNGLPDGPPWNVPRTVLFPPFTAVLLRKRVFLNLGGLDEQFESYLEDVDYGLRSAAAKYTGRYVPEAVVWHEGSGTLGSWSAGTVRMIARNQVLLVAKHYDRSTLGRLGWNIAVAQLLWGAVAARHGQGLAWLQGKFEGLRLLGSLKGTGLSNLEEVLRDSEQTMKQLQRETGQDSYWRWYFRLTS